MAKPPFPWIGSKEKIAPYILQTFPAKLAQYVEPFGGSGADAGTHTFTGVFVDDGKRHGI